MRFPALFSLVLLAAASAPAGDGSLSRDGRVFVGSPMSDTLIRADLEAGTWEPFDPTAFGAPKDFQPAGTDNRGLILGHSGRTLWGLDTTATKATKLWTAPKGSRIDDLAYDAKSDATVVALSWPGRGDSPLAPDGRHYLPLFMHVPRDARRAVHLSARRVDSMDGMAFDSAGRLLFGYLGDLWYGSTEPVGDTDAEKALLSALRAERVAPVAMPETDNSTPSGMGVKQLAAGTGGRVVAWLGRMNGTGFGTVVAMKTPADDHAGGNYRAEIAARVSSGWLKSLTTLTPIANCRPCLCATADGSRIIYFEEFEWSGVVSGSRQQLTAVIIDGDAAPRKIQLSRK